MAWTRRAESSSKCRKRVATGVRRAGGYVPPGRSFFPPAKTPQLPATIHRRRLLATISTAWRTNWIGAKRATGFDRRDKKGCSCTNHWYSACNQWLGRLVLVQVDGGWEPGQSLPHRLRFNGILNAPSQGRGIVKPLVVGTSRHGGFHLPQVPCGKGAAGGSQTASVALSSRVGQREPVVVQCGLARGRDRRPLSVPPKFFASSRSLATCRGCLLDRG